MMRKIDMPRQIAIMIGGSLADLKRLGVTEVDINSRQDLALILFGDNLESKEREEFLNQFEPIQGMKLVRL